MSFRFVALILVAVNVVLFVVQAAVPGFTEAFLLRSADAAARPWILITSVFLHGSVSHLLGNMFALGLFGSILEKIIGWKRFIAVFFAAGVIASFGSMFFYAAALGASGAIFGLLGTLAALRPKMMVWVFGAPMPMAAAAGLWLLIDLAGTFAPSSVANIAHIIGLLFGAGAGMAWRSRFSETHAEKSRESVVDEGRIDKWEDEWM